MQRETCCEKLPEDHRREAVVKGCGVKHAAEIGWQSIGMNQSKDC